MRTVTAPLTLTSSSNAYSRPSAAVAADIRRRMPDADRALVHKLPYCIQGTHLPWKRGLAFE